VHGESSNQARQALRELPYAPRSDPHLPPSPSPSKPPASRKPRLPTPPPEIDDEDITMVEEFEEHHLLPPSSPPPPSTPPQPARAYRPSGAAARAAALAEINDIASDAPSSSPPRPPAKLPRVEASSSRLLNTEAGPSSEPIAQQPRRVEVAVRHPWSKEVEGKLRTYFKLPGFRLHQREAIDQTMAGKDGEFLRDRRHRSRLTLVFVLMPTGGGKSLTCKLCFSVTPANAQTSFPLFVREAGHEASPSLSLL